MKDENLKVRCEFANKCNYRSCEHISIHYKNEYCVGECSRAIKFFGVKIPTCISAVTLEMNRNGANKD